MNHTVNKAGAISGVLLAAGESRRMGEFKQLLPLAGKTFVEHCVDNMLGSGLAEVIVVTGHREADVRRALGDRPIKFAYNPDYKQGMSSSIKRGVEAVSHGAAAVLVALVDQPLVGPEVFIQVIEAYQTLKSSIIIPTFNGRKGHPVVLDLSLKSEILAMDPARGLRQVVGKHEGEVARVAIASEAVLIDFDLPEDYRRVVDGHLK